MVADGLLTRQRYREVPPRVDYELTERSRELLPVLGALARWGYDWTWSSPRSGEDINVGAIFRLAPGLLTPSGDVNGVVDLVVSAEGEDPELRFRLSASGGQASISERSFDGRADATVTGSRSEWVRALGPEGSVDDVDVRGDSALADELLGAFVRAAQHRAAVRAA
jgi:hypothetical protein